MQMYRVKFAIRLSGGMVDKGDVLVCAHNQDAAVDLVGFHLNLKMTEAEIVASRVKPSIYQLSRQEVQNSLTAFGAGIVSVSAASSATFPGTTENRPDEHWYTVQAQANIRAQDENDALSSLSKAIVRDLQGKPQKTSCKDFDAKSDLTTDMGIKPSSVEQNALYTFRQIFAGGAGRPR